MDRLQRTLEDGHRCPLARHDFAPVPDDGQASCKFPEEPVAYVQLAIVKPVVTGALLAEYLNVGTQQLALNLAAQPGEQARTTGGASSSNGSNNKFSQ